jgi:hypothetical protein
VASFNCRQSAIVTIEGVPSGRRKSTLFMSSGRASMMYTNGRLSAFFVLEKRTP